MKMGRVNRFRWYLKPSADHYTNFVDFEDFGTDHCHYLCWSLCGRSVWLSLVVA